MDPWAVAGPAEAFLAGTPRIAVYGQGSGMLMTPVRSAGTVP
jgi:hypothetical protein